MKRLTSRAGILLMPITALLLVFAAGRQARATHHGIEFTATVAGPIHNLFMIPIEPAVGSAQERMAGQSSLFEGETRWIGKHLVHFTVEGGHLRYTGGTGILYDLRDSAVFMNYSGFNSTEAGGTIVS